MAQAERIAKALDPTCVSVGNDDGSTSWKTKCPAHNDRKASLSITQQQDKILVRCHAGCSQGEVINALKERKLWHSRKRTAEDNENWEWAGAAPVGTEIKVKMAPNNPRALSKASAHWVYRDETGKLLGAIYRFDTADGKEIRPVTWWHNTSSGELLWRLKTWPGARPLYNWDLLSQYKDKKVLVVEGEKTADAANKLLPDDWIATTWPGGTKAINRANWSILKDRIVVMWPDLDDVGIMAMENLSAISERIGFESYRGVYPPKEILPSKWDLADPIPEKVNMDIMNLINTSVKIKPLDVDKQASTFGPPPMTEAEVCNLLNERFAAIDVAGTPHIVIYPTDEQPTYRMGTYDQYSKLHANMKFLDIYTNKIRKQIPVWWEHPDRKTFPNGLTFEPAGEREIDGKYNTWSGFHILPKVEGSCDLFLRHIQENVADGDTWVFEWIMMWFAHIFQKPGKKPGTSLALRGSQGCGKSIVGEIFGHCLGDELYLVVDNTETLFGQNNFITMRVLLVQAEEAFWAGTKKDLGKIKHLITSTHHTYQDKYIRQFKAPNYNRLFITSNETWVVPAAADDRRFTIMDVNGTRANDRDYFGKIWEQIENGGAEKLVWTMMNYSISDTEIGTPLDSDAREEQKVMSMDILDQWIYARLNDGVFIPQRSTSFEEYIYGADIMAALSDFAKDKGQLRNVPAQRTVASRFEDILGHGFQRKVSSKPITGIDNKHVMRPVLYELNCGLEKARMLFQKHMGTKLYWEDAGLEIKDLGEHDNVYVLDKAKNDQVPF